MNSDNLDTFQIEYQAGKSAFERGEYQKAVDHLEAATAIVGQGSSLGGEVQMWLVTAYDAANQHPEAIALCKKLTRHPHLDTRQQSRNLLYILEAPRLKSRPECLTQIPDLTALDGSDTKPAQISSPSTKNQQSPPSFELQPINLDQVKPADNRFIWIALMGIIIILGGFFWLNQ